MIKYLGYNDFDALEFATVTAAPPNLRIKIDNMKIECDADDLVVSECLTDHIGVIKRADGTDETITYMDSLKVGDRVIVSSMNDGQAYAILDRFKVYRPEGGI
ncbi:DUF2577 family protein [Paenibacillus sp. SI92]|uniref:DUF2577 family protein n=1 Tax=Paenibacillus sp. SI92 TaxID=3163027 RepID=UPI00346777FC